MAGNYLHPKFLNQHFMKKILFSFGLIFIVLNASGQENMVSKQGTSILPEAGDYSIGFDATPFLYYLGNMFNQNGNTPPTADFTYGNPYIITGMYMKSATEAYRGRLGLGFGIQKQDSIVPLVGPSISDLTTTNTTKLSNSSVTIGAGKQWSRGKHRVRGNYGVDAFIGFGTQKTTYDYGQELSDTNNLGGNSRNIEDKSGTTFGLGVRGFVSVEYFFAPKISFSAQYGWGVSFESTGKGKITEEYWDSFDQKVKTTDAETGKSSNFYFGSSGKGFDNTGGSIALNFYF